MIAMGRNSTLETQASRIGFAVCVLPLAVLVAACGERSAADAPIPGSVASNLASCRWIMSATSFTGRTSALSAVFTPVSDRPIDGQSSRR